MNRAFLTAILTGACLAVAAQPAAAIQVTGPYFDMFDRTGINNEVTVTQVASDRVRVSDPAGVSFDSEGTTFTGQCVAENPQAAMCVVHVPITFVPIFDVGAGDDSLNVESFPFPVHTVGGPGNDRLVGPVPQPVPSLHGSPNRVDLVGGSGNDVLIGNSGPDTMRGEDGDDVCIGGLGGDYCGLGLGSDRCDMGPGADRCGGGPGGDSCFAGAGDDVCNGAKGRDACSGGPGRDRGVRCERGRGLEKSFPEGRA